MTQEIITITMRDVRAAKMCSRGARVFFEKHGLDWQTFLKAGIKSDVLEKINDGMANQVIKVARNGR